MGEREEKKKESSFFELNYTSLSDKPLHPSWLEPATMTSDEQRAIKRARLGKDKRSVTKRVMSVARREFCAG